MWSVLATIGFLLLLVGLCGAFQPIPALRVPSRGRGVLVAVVGAVLLSVGAVNDPTTQQRMAEAEAARAGGSRSVPPARFESGDGVLMSGWDPATGAVEVRQINVWNGPDRASTNCQLSHQAKATITGRQFRQDEDRWYFSVRSGDCTGWVPDPFVIPDPVAAALVKLHETIEAEALTDDVRSVRLDGQRLVVEFTVADNLTTNMMVGGARSDVAEIAKAAAGSGLEFGSLFVGGYATMVDTYGQENDRRVIGAVYTRDTLRRVNWANFLDSNIFRIADSADLHPSFR